MAKRTVIAHEADEAELDTAQEVNVYAELLEVAKAGDPTFIEKHPKEDVQTFLKRFCRAVSDAPEDDWDALEEDGLAQTWFSGAAGAIQNRMPISLPDGFNTSDFAAKPVDVPIKRTGAMALVELNAAKRAKKALEAANPVHQPVQHVEPPMPVVHAVKPVKEKPAKAAKQARAEGAVTYMRRIVINNPAITASEIEANVKAKGYTSKSSTVAAVRACTLSTLRLAKEMAAR